MEFYRTWDVIGFIIHLSKHTHKVEKSVKSIIVAVKNTQVAL